MLAAKYVVVSRRGQEPQVLEGDADTLEQPRRSNPSISVHQIVTNQGKARHTSFNSTATLWISCPTAMKSPTEKPKGAAMTLPQTQCE